MCPLRQAEDGWSQEFRSVHTDQLGVAASARTFASGQVVGVWTAQVSFRRLESWLKSWRYPVAGSVVFVCGKLCLAANVCAAEIETIAIGAHRWGRGKLCAYCSVRRCVVAI